MRWTKIVFIVWCWLSVGFTVVFTFYFVIRQIREGSFTDASILLCGLWLTTSVLAMFQLFEIQETPA